MLIFSVKISLSISRKSEWKRNKIRKIIVQSRILGYIYPVNRRSFGNSKNIDDVMETPIKYCLFWLSHFQDGGGLENPKFENDEILFLFIVRWKFHQQS